MAEWSRDEVYAAWRRRMELQDADDWSVSDTPVTATINSGRQVEPVGQSVLVRQLGG